MAGGRKILLSPKPTVCSTPGSDVSDLGRAYLKETGAFREADSEFDRCIKRSGEALSLFLDPVPTFGYFPPVYYYQGRVREGLKSAGFAEAYRKYMDISRESRRGSTVLAEVAAPRRRQIRSLHVKHLIESPAGLQNEFSPKG